jgi:CBS domain-containing protein
MDPTSDKIKNMVVSDFMTKNVKTVTENETMRQACKLMYQENIGSVVILKKDTDEKEQETPVGIVTERDIARMIGLSAKNEIEYLADTDVSDVMSKPLITITPKTSLRDAVALMDEKNIRRLPVVNYKGEMAGIVTAKDILKAVINIFKETMKDQDFMSEGFDLLGLIGTE